MKKSFNPSDRTELHDSGIPVPLTQVGHQTSALLGNFAKMTGDIEMGRLARGIEGLTQGFSGMRDLSNGLQMMQMGGNALSSISGMLGGANAVLTAIQIVSSLFDDDDDDGENPFEQIYSSMMEMWSETRRNFTKTWEKLDEIQDILIVKDQKDYERFMSVMSAIDHVREDIMVSIQLNHSTLMRQQKTLEAHLMDIKSDIKSYLNCLCDQPLQETLLEIAKSEPHEVERDVLKHSNRLKLWLTQTAAMNAHRADEGLPRMNRLQADPFDVPLGLFVTMAEEIAPGIFPARKEMTFIYPKHWCETLRVYMKVMYLAQKSIAQKSQEVQLEYLKEIQSLKKVILDTFQVFEFIANSEQLWSTLKARYQASLIPLFELLKKIEPQSKTLLSDAEPLLMSIQQHYSQMVHFFHLLNPGLDLLTVPIILQNIRRDLEAIAALPTQAYIDVPLQSLLTRLQSKEIWQETLPGNLKENLKSVLPNHPVLFVLST